MLAKPTSCAGCSLEERGRGYVPPIGRTDAPIVFVGEAAGEQEASNGEPFWPAAPAGAMLNRITAYNSWGRGDFRIDNVCRCQPPKNWFDERAPWYRSAAEHCTKAHLQQTLQGEHHKVIVPLGGTALRWVMGLHKGIRVEDWHGTVSRAPDNKHWVVPTFHTSHLARGAHNLFGVVSFDLQIAHQVARQGYVQDDVSILVDPPVDWFTCWVETVEAACRQDPLSVWLATDIETPDKAGKTDEGELGQDDRSYQITRVNFSVHPDEGISVPYAGPYIPLIERLLRLPCPKPFWNKEYDEPRLIKAGHSHGGDWLDFMWAWHKLQSDVPRGLGFASSFYCRWGPWKHLSESDPGFYAACDGFKTYRTGWGVAHDLQAAGQWTMFLRHTHVLWEQALQPARAIGVKIDRAALLVFIHDLEVKQRRILHEMQGLVPDEVRPLTPKGGYKREPEEGRVHAKGTAIKRDGTAKKEAPDPIKQELYAQTSRLVHRRVSTLAYTCHTCGLTDVGAKHRCPAGPQLQFGEVEVDRWYWQEPFNPDSPDQILAYMRHRRHEPGKARKTGNDSTDRETLERLTRETKDPLYGAILKSRAVGKVRGTYGEGTLKRMDGDDRIHPAPTDKPSTGRLSYVNPNITNVITDRDEVEENLAAGFRRCVVADQTEPQWWQDQHVRLRLEAEQRQAPAVHTGTRLFEADFAGIEAVLTGWFCRQDPHYIRLAKLGVHAGLASHVLGRPYSPEWDDARIAAYFKEIKASEPVLYDRAKRTVHGSNYGLTEYGMVRNFPQVFPTLAVAKKFKALYHAMAPAVPQFQSDVRQIAYDLHYLGGAQPPKTYSNAVAQVFANNPDLMVHPFGYKHWFWSVTSYRAIPAHIYLKRLRNREPVVEINGKYYAVGLGEDAKRCVAFFPQSTAAGVLKEVMLRLFNPAHPSYIGDAYYGRTPLRAPIHDSLLLEIPNRVWDQVVERVFREMLRPIPELPLNRVDLKWVVQYGFGKHLSINVEAKAGLNWKDMQKIQGPTMQELGLSTDGVYFSAEDELAEEAEDVAALGTVA